ncbi:MAG TPA: hypothetical protein VKE22_30305 [Haliangiales bacterium]|nr:hypothetical protein [Haliangiales bacterium]
MDIAVFRPHELPVALGAVRGVDPQPTPMQDRFLEVVGRLHRVTIDPRSLPAPSPRHTAETISDPHRRKRLLQLAMVMTTIDGSVARTSAEKVSQLAAALGVDERGVKTLHKMAAHQDTLARLDLLRRVGGRLVGSAWRDERWSGVRKVLAAGFAGGVEEVALARRYNRLGLLPEGSFGRALWQHWVERDFSMPGQRNGIPEIAIFHDLGHVLAGYDTDPVGEIQQAAFQAGFVRNDGFMFLFFAIAQFHLGLKITPIAEAEVGKLDIEKVMTALARGAACTVDLSDHWDFWPHLPRPLEEVRAELEIPPLP